MADIKGLGDQLVSLTVKEVSELALYLKETHGIVPAAAAVMAGPSSGGATGGGAEEVEEKTEFDVILVNPGGAKLGVVKVVKMITGLGLKEAKDLVDNAPSPIKQAISKAEAEVVKAQLVEAGAEVELK